MKILVTGGAGFIGSHVTDLLVNKGYEVVVVDKKLRNTNPEAKYYEQDITNYEELKKIFEKERPEIVNHHAGQVSVPESVNNPVFDAEQNIIGTLNLLKLSVQQGIKNFVFASTCAVYGNPLTKKVSENHETRPLSPYATSKLSSEAYIKLFAQNHVILRYANVYGPRQVTKGEGAVIQTFIKKMKQKKLVTIHGDGNQTRDFIHVSDVALANLKAVQLRKRIILNVGTGKGTSVNELFNTLKKLIPYKLKPLHSEPRPGDIRHMVLNAERMEKELGTYAKTSLEEGLAQTIPKI